MGNKFKDFENFKEFSIVIADKYIPNLFKVEIKFENITQYIDLIRADSNEEALKEAYKAYLEIVNYNYGN